MYVFLKNVYFLFLGLIPYIKMRLFLKGSYIGRNVRIGRKCHFRGKNQAYIGNNTKLGDNCFIEIIGINKKDKLHIGDNVSVTGSLFVSCMEKITIGDNALIANNVRIYDSNHGMNPDLGNYEEQEFSKKRVFIDEGVWIGDNVIILAGATIGKKCIIGAGSIVTGEVPAYTIAAGVPAKPIKKWNSKNQNWERV